MQNAIRIMSDFLGHDYDGIWLAHDLNRRWDLRIWEFTNTEHVMKERRVLVYLPFGDTQRRSVQLVASYFFNTHISQLNFVHYYGHRNPGP